MYQGHAIAVLLPGIYYIINSCILYHKFKLWWSSSISKESILYILDRFVYNSFLYYIKHDMLRISAICSILDLSHAEIFVSNNLLSWSHLYILKPTQNPNNSQLIQYIIGISYKSQKCAVKIFLDTLHWNQHTNNH